MNKTWTLLNDFYLNYNLWLFYGYSALVAFNSDSTAADGVFDSSGILNACVSSLTHNFHPCKYYEKDSLSSLSFNSNSISIIHINIRSLQKNFDSLQEFLCLLPIMPKIICLSESRINQKPLINLELPNYKLEHIDSPTLAAGVAVYVSNELRIEIFRNLVWTLMDARICG